VSGVNHLFRVVFAGNRSLRRIPVMDAPCVMPN
jgi:hypothetical protein